MFHLILFEPEIPPNTGNIIRLCANTGVTLHLVQPLGFSLDDAQLRRAGLDYRDLAEVREHPDLAACLASLDGARVFAVEARSGARHTERQYRVGDAFLFGRETRGLPTELLATLARRSTDPATDDSRQPQPQSLERRRDRHLRSLAPARLRRQRVARPACGIRRGPLAPPELMLRSENPVTSRAPAVDSATTGRAARWAVASRANS